MDENGNYMVRRTPEIIQGNVVEVLGPKFKNFDGGRVLDIATAQGGFVGVLKAILPSYKEIIGVDIKEELLEKARETYPEENIRFEVMDAGMLSFSDDQFDIVGIGYSLHHLEDIQTVLIEMYRVLKPGGVLIVVEMYQDELQFSETLIHHWAADVDRARGIYHNHTLMRNEIIECLEDLNWIGIEFFDYCDQPQNQMDEDLINSIYELIDMILSRVEGMPIFEDFKKRGEELRDLVSEFGVSYSRRLACLAWK